MQDSFMKGRHPTLAEDVLSGRYDPPDDLFRKDRRRYAEEVRRLDEVFRAEALAAAGLANHPKADQILQVAQRCAGVEDRMRLLRCLIHIADLVRSLEGSREKSA